MPKIGKRLFALGLGLLLPLLLGECALRLLAPASGWGSVPALEDRVGALDAPAAAPRVIALGDSFTEYKDSSGDNFFRYALAALGKPVDAHNLAQMGTGVPHYRKVFETYGAKAKPDVVVVGLYLGNDVLDYELDLRKQARGLQASEIKIHGRRPDGLGAKVKRASAIAGLAARLLRRARQSESYLDSNLHHASEIMGLSDEELARRRAAADPKWVQLAENEAINPWDLAWAIAAPERYRELLLLEGEWAPRGFDEFLAGVEALDREIKASGAKPVFVLLPILVQVDPSYDAYLKALGVELPDAVHAETTPLWSRLRAALDERGVRYVDALPALRAATAEGVLFLENDTHLSDLGQQVAARPLADVLQELVP